MIIHDEPQRIEALDPNKSFIIQAPAGSGKTELLTQRFLKLLNVVKQPEEILAITFTRKSAAEMRSRVIQALQNAKNEPEPALPHAKKTWKLAKNALTRSQQLHWHLLENPNRLRIQTIDSFYAYLTKQLPILSHFGATPDIIDNPSALYQEAVQELLMHLEENVEWSDAIATLFIHLDNDYSKIQTLLCQMLAKRDQWLYVIAQPSSLLRRQLENHLTHISMDLLKNCSQTFPEILKNELFDLSQLSANHLLKQNTHSPITALANLTLFPGDDLQDKSYWLGISALLLTKDFNWRKKIDKNLGFPAPSEANNPNEKMMLTQVKERMLGLLDQLQSNEALRIALKELSLSPHPHYTDLQWDTLSALQKILTLLTAQLKLIFQKYNQIDYIENAQAASHALGSEDAPTDINLALDYQIQHILMDEFQDTSNNQYRLIEKLTLGWQGDDGRTLFLVGDPMQSIYRFREAEVGLFIRAKHQGIGNIILHPLTLSVNFRSNTRIIHWVNTHFSTIFPSYEDIAMGAVPYSPSTAHQDDEIKEPAVSYHRFFDNESSGQAQAIAQLVLTLKKQFPEQTIAILVRSRTHLLDIIPALKSANLLFKAIDIDPLHATSVIQDLMALTRALIHPADRIAWLALLRAPWCGLCLKDLHILANHSSQISLWECLQNKTAIDQLSEEGKKQLSRILPILNKKIADRQRYSLREWIENTWILLGGPATMTHENDLHDAKAYFDLLVKIDQGGNCEDIDELIEQVNHLYASPHHQADDSLQIMTIHNAKGLEFDTVILPHLERKIPHDPKQLLLWMERTRSVDRSDLILAPINAIGEDCDPIYEYIKQQQKAKAEYETIRLLYVAVTRTKKRLHLFFSLPQDAKNITPQSLLHPLWDTIKNDDDLTIPSHDIKPLVTENKTKLLKRLSLDWKNPINDTQPALVYHQKNTGFRLTDHNPRLIGILIHQILQNIVKFGADFWLNTTSVLHIQYVESQLTQLGILPTELSSARDIVLTAIHQTLNDAKGRWIISKHQEDQTEWPLTVFLDNKIQSLIIDRTFVDSNNIRWIIDYKTSSPGQLALKQFLENEKNQYQEQMQKYADAVRLMDPRPISMGLYFPLISSWLEI